MKFEYGIIIVLGFLVFAILALVASGPNEMPSLAQLNQINQQGVLAQETENKGKLEANRSLMKEKLEKLASRELGIPDLEVFLEEYYFPFKDASEIQLDGGPSETFPICDIIPKIPIHLQMIQNSDMFSMFIEKYRGYPIELFVQDERSFNSTIHYSLIVTSADTGDSASTWFHLDSCTDQMSVPYNLSCRNKQNEDFMHTRYRNEIVESLEDEKFCEIRLEPWRQVLYDYTQTISDEMKKHQQKLEAIKDDPTFEVVMAFQLQMERFGLLSNMASHAMTGEYDDEKMKEMKKKYIEKYGSIPDDLLELIENENTQTT